MTRIKRYSKAIIYIKLVLAIIFWGSVYPTAKYLIGGNSVIEVALIRYLLATIFLFIVYYRRRTSCIKVTTKKQLVYLFMVGIVGVYLYQVAFLLAESLISANMVAILYSFTPCITLILSCWLLGYKLTKLLMLGVLIALIGAVGVIFFNHANFSSNELSYTKQYFFLSLGEIFALLTVLLSAIYSILNRKIYDLGLDSLTITFYGFLFGTLALFCNWCVMGHYDLMHILHHHLLYWLAMCYIAIFATAFAYFWYVDATVVIGVDQTAIFLNGIPFASVLIDVVLLGGKIQLSVILFGIIIILGVIITNFEQFKNKQFKK